jgi:putative NADH-flavin reductase
MTAARTLALFGATGRTGRAVISAAFFRGWAVRALVRPRNATLEESPALETVLGDYSIPAKVAETAIGTDAACIVFGPRPPFTEAFCAEATLAVIGALRLTGPRRLICQTGAQIGTDLPNWSAPIRWMARSFQRSRPEVAEDRLEQERAVRESGLDWTILKPPRLTNGPRTGRVRIGSELSIGLFSRISRADLADVILNQVDQPQLYGKAVFVVG